MPQPTKKLTLLSRQRVFRSFVLKDRPNPNHYLSVRRPALKLCPRASLDLAAISPDFPKYASEKPVVHKPHFGYNQKSL